MVPIQVDCADRARATARRVHSCRAEGAVPSAKPDHHSTVWIGQGKVLGAVSIEVAICDPGNLLIGTPIAHGRREGAGAGVEENDESHLGLVGYRYIRRTISVEVGHGRR